jgi:hypothetical protein
MTAGPAGADAPGTQRPAPPLRLDDWLRAGIRAAFFRRPATDASWQPTPAQLAALVAFAAVLQLGLARLEVDGPASFHLRGWLLPWWSAGASLLAAWWLLWRLPADPRRPAGVAAWLVLGLAASLPMLAANEGAAIARAHGALPALLETAAWAAWGLFLALAGWGIGVTVFLGRVFGMPPARLAALLAVTVVLQALHAWQFTDRPWSPDRSRDPEPERFSLSQDVFERQQAAWTAAVDRLAPQRPGVVDLYAIVFAPYAAEDVFLRESTMVGEVLAQRFDAAGRVLQLVNHRSTAATLPWATPQNLQRAVAAVADRMDRDEDVLVVYLTSHGGNDFRLAAWHWPLQVEALEARQLREALDAAGIRHRVVAVSACYSGGWVEPLASEGTLVMTAADATHTSYGAAASRR